ncbi:hypothetical protein P9139_04965 [Curtobacterium flaccumfaciens]|nr:hypothetical protein P9139_04965 [Curtobacterium flaccumfaciens]
MERGGAGEQVQVIGLRIGQAQCAESPASTSADGRGARPCSSRT